MGGCLGIHLEAGLELCVCLGVTLCLGVTFCLSEEGLGLYHGTWDVCNYRKDGRGNLGKGNN